MLTKCDKCKTSIDVQPQDIVERELDGLEIQYFDCRYCGAHYLYMAKDEKFRELIAERERLQNLLRIGRQKRFRPKTLAGYIDRIEAVSREQKALLPQLRERGLAALEKMDEGGGK